MPELSQMVDGVIVNNIILQEGEISLGRHPENTVQINEIAVSTRHAKIRLEKNKYLEEILDIFVEDLNSTNGTFVNDERVEGSRRLVNNDVVRLGWNEFKIVDGIESTFEETAHILDV
ncbi:MAG: FHA domain-containing protein [Pseudomonadales bacterium]|nr:FHA domain-containing protein [Pseudomonadales bacterium]